MDQRNAGASTAPVTGTETGATYTADQLLFSVPEAFLPTIETPLLVLQGNDEHHPPSVSRLLAGSVPGAQLIEQWKGEEHLPLTAARIREFLGGS